MTKIDNIKNWQCFANAIVLAAVDDYKQAVKVRNADQMKALERFFIGDWCALLTNDNGEYILRNLKKKLGVQI